MKIAIIAPSPVPFAIGGAENLFWGLLQALNQETTHQAELIKLPSREAGFLDLIDSYEAFSKLDLAYFDCVISTKYPAWMTPHSRHICYLQHRLRGLYDTYHLTGLPLDPVATSPTVGKLLDLMEAHPGDRSAFAEVMGLAREVAAQHATEEISGSASHPLAFPGPLIRRMVHFFDEAALSAEHIHKYAAISANVAGRADYFPPNVPVSVVHHPSNLGSFQSGDYEYLFTVGRLDGPKRISLLIQAMRYVQSPVTLKIAGTGPDEAHLKALAATDERIEFLGFVQDDALPKYYADALAVPFFPYDEDYGLITIEAMMSRKPVLTTLDAGGPNEFVEDGRTGFSVAPQPEALAAKIDYLYTHKKEAAAMGAEAARRVSPITWGRVIDTLIENGSRRVSAHHAAPSSKKLTVALTFPVYPPRGGGQSRVYHLYKCLARDWKIDLVTFAQHDQPPLNREIAPGLREIRIPKSLAHQQAEGRIAAKLGGVPAEDVVMPELYALTPVYSDALSASATDADVLVASHPYLVDALREVSKAPLWYEAHNVEWQLKKHVLPDNDAGKALLESVYAVEKRACDAAQVIMMCSEQDGKTLQTIYGAAANIMVCVPNGVDLEGVIFRSDRARKFTKATLDLIQTPTACFMGSWHPPNMDAVQTLLDFAPQCPDILFFIFGSVCDAMLECAIPPNVKMLGVLDEEEKQVVLDMSDLALNPMDYGSGTNLKMLDYFAAGLPVLSTPFGARGLGLTPQENVLVAELPDFAPAVRNFFTLDRDQCHLLIQNARTLVEQHYDWKVISDRFKAWLNA